MQAFGRTRCFSTLITFFTICGLATFSQAQNPTGTSPTTPSSSVSSGIIKGTIVDGTGAVVVGAHVELKHGDQAVTQQQLSDDDGQFSFADVPFGVFHLSVTAPAFGPQTASGELHAGEILTVPQIVLPIATATMDVRVVETRAEIATDEIKVQEEQRIFGVIPNFYVSYVPDAVPLASKQKFDLAWKTIIDPVSVVITGITAGAEQAADSFHGYGQGAQGYGKRFGAAYGDLLIGTMITSAILPSLLKQDPRYFYKGTGTNKSRTAYALANAVICKGDNGRWQPNYSNILGSLAAGGISNLYYPAEDRNGAGLTFENAGIGIVATAGANLAQEFLVRRFTPKVHNRKTKQLSAPSNDANSKN